ncbi:hypothetical protein DdX_17483 [Ditylenchus destructor]|uniref:F-box domain-containing protein n=1 Tax=Ditylenchus destructor TaxID=166010 RepID=A0AAD4MP07_9BILA|nr:hypothetical protein DdX_17483 [Ditylenchus destructor]
MSNIAAMDNGAMVGTMVDTFKYLNYCQLAKNSLVSKRFRDLIRTHRNVLARLYVENMGIKCFFIDRSFIKMFDEELSPEAYDEWVILNQYSKEIPLEDRNASMQIAENEFNIYTLWANANYKDLNRTNRVLRASAELNHEYWPLFQYFAHLITDPFVYIRFVELIPQMDVLNLLASSIHSDHNRIQCDVLVVNLRDNMHGFISWIKDHMLCKEIRIDEFTISNYDEEFLDFFLTGGHCTLEFNSTFYDYFKVVMDLVQKFMALKSIDECRVVESIRGYISNESVEEVKRNYSKFIVKEDRNEDDGSTEQVFEFDNNDIGKKMKLNIRILLRSDLGYHYRSAFSLKIASL